MIYRKSTLKFDLYHVIYRPIGYDRILTYPAERTYLHSYVTRLSERIDFCSKCIGEEYLTRRILIPIFGLSAEWRQILGFGRRKTIVGDQRSFRTNEKFAWKRLIRSRTDNFVFASGGQNGNE